MAVLSFDLKGIQDAITDFSRITQFEVVTFFLFIGVLVTKEIALEGRHFRLVEEGRVLAAPEVKEIVAGIVAGVFVGLGLKGCPDHHADIVHQILATI